MIGQTTTPAPMTAAQQQAALLNPGAFTSEVMQGALILAALGVFFLPGALKLLGPGILVALLIAGNWKTCSQPTTVGGPPVTPAWSCLLNPFPGGL